MPAETTINAFYVPNFVLATTAGEDVAIKWELSEGGIDDDGIPRMRGTGPTVTGTVYVWDSVSARFEDEAGNPVGISLAIPPVEADGPAILVVPSFDIDPTTDWPVTRPTYSAFFVFGGGGRKAWEDYTDVLVFHSDVPINLSGIYTYNNSRGPITQYLQTYTKDEINLLIGGGMSIAILANIGDVDDTMPVAGNALMRGAGSWGPRNLAAGDILSGQFAMARLASGAATGSKFIRDDGALAVPAGTGAPTTARYLVVAADAGLTAESLLQGTVNQIAATDGGSGNPLVLSAPQDLDAAANFRAGSLRLGTALTTELLNLAAAGYLGVIGSQAPASYNANAGFSGAVAKALGSRTETAWNGAGATVNIDSVNLAPGRIVTQRFEDVSGGAATADPPLQPQYQVSTDGIRSAFALSGAWNVAIADATNITHLMVGVRALGTAPLTAIWGQAIGNVSGAHVWGLNGIAYNLAAGLGSGDLQRSACFGAEFNIGDIWTGASLANTTAVGLLIVEKGNGGVTKGSYIQCGSDVAANAGGLLYGISFNGSGTSKPVTQALFYSDAAGVKQSAYGIDFGIASFSGGAFRLGSGQKLVFRNAANSADLDLVTANGDDSVTWGKSVGGNLFFNNATFGAETGAIECRNAANSNRKVFIGSSQADGNAYISAIETSVGWQELVIQGGGGTVRLGGTLNLGGGIDVASAATITLPVGNVFVITGVTNIGTINETAGVGPAHPKVIHLIFAGILTVQDGAGNLNLAGDFVTTNGDVLTIVSNGAGGWWEVSRSVN